MKKNMLISLLVKSKDGNSTNQPHTTTTMTLVVVKEAETPHRPAVYAPPSQQATLFGVSYAQISVLSMVGVACLSVLFALYSPIVLGDEGVMAAWILAAIIVVGVWIFFVLAGHRPRRSLPDRFHDSDQFHEVDLSPKVEHPLQGVVIPPPEPGDSIGTNHH